MSITEKLLRIARAKAAIKSSIQEKGVQDVGDVLEDYAEKIAEIPQGSDPVIQLKNITENGIYSPEEGVDGFAPVIVSVPQPQPVIQAKNITENGTYNPPTGVDGFAPVVVNVPQSEPVLRTLNTQANGTFTPDAGVDGFDKVIVAVPQEPTGRRLRLIYPSPVFGAVVHAVKYFQPNENVSEWVNETVVNEEATIAAGIANNRNCPISLYDENSYSAFTYPDFAGGALGGRMPDRDLDVFIIPRCKDEYSDLFYVNTSSGDSLTFTPKNGGTFTLLETEEEIEVSSGESITIPPYYLGWVKGPAGMFDIAMTTSNVTNGHCLNAIISTYHTDSGLTAKSLAGLTDILFMTCTDFCPSALKCGMAYFDLWGLSKAVTAKYTMIEDTTIDSQIGYFPIILRDGNLSITVGRQTFHQYNIHILQ